jgi:MFS family permease
VVGVETAPAAAWAEFDLSAARRTRSYWIMMAAAAAWGMIGTGIYFNIIPLFAESGLSESTAASTFAVLSIAMGITHVIGGYLADKAPLNWLAAASMAFLISGIGVLMQMGASGMWQLYPVFFGIGQGLIAIVGSTVWVRYYGRAHLGKIRGSIWTFTVIGTSLGPFIMGFTNDLFGSYRTSLLLFVGLLVPIMIAALWATPPGRAPDHSL